MPYLNHVTLMGHLVADPEIKKTPAGDSVAAFTLGLNSRSRDGKERADFFDCEVWQAFAENLCKTAKKGSLVLVQGYLRQEQWVDSKTNNKRSRVKVRATRAFHVEAQYAGGDGEPALETEAQAQEGGDTPF